MHPQSLEGRGASMKNTERPKADKITTNRSSMASRTLSSGGGWGRGGGHVCIVEPLPKASPGLEHEDASDLSRHMWRLRS